MNTPHRLPQIVIGRRRDGAAIQNDEVRLIPRAGRIQTPLAQ